MASVYLSGPAIARLKVCTLMAANKQLRAGRFGPVLMRGRVAYAERTAVERHVGRQFAQDQIEAAIDGRPERMLTVTPEN